MYAEMQIITAVTREITLLSTFTSAYQLKTTAPPKWGNIHPKKANDYWNPCSQWVNTLSTGIIVRCGKAGLEGQLCYDNVCN